MKLDMLQKWKWWRLIPNRSRQDWRNKLVKKGSKELLNWCCDPRRWGVSLGGPVHVGTQKNHQPWKQSSYSRLVQKIVLSEILRPPTSVTSLGWRRILLRVSDGVADVTQTFFPQLKYEHVFPSLSASHSPPQYRHGHEQLAIASIHTHEYWIIVLSFQYFFIKKEPACFRKSGIYKLKSDYQRNTIILLKIYNRFYRTHKTQFNKIYI